MNRLRNEMVLFFEANSLLWLYVACALVLSILTNDFVNLPEWIWEITLFSAFTGLILLWGIAFPLIVIVQILKRKKKFHFVRMFGFLIGGWLLVNVFWSGLFHGYQVWEHHTAFGGLEGKILLKEKGEEAGIEKLGLDYVFESVTFQSAMFLPENEAAMNGPDHPTVTLHFVKENCKQDYITCNPKLHSKYENGKWSAFYLDR